MVIAEPAIYLPAIPAPEIEVAYQYALNEKSEGTRKGYAADFRLFTSWCSARGVSTLPASPETVAGYLASLAQGGLMPATISRRCSAVRYAHKLANLESPTDKEAVKATVRGIRRTINLPSKRKSPILSEHARAMVSGARADMKGTRDKAILLLGFAGAFRRSELVALDVGDLEETDDGYRVTIRRSKTDQEGQGVVIAIPRGSPATCPVKAVKAWLSAAGIESGPIFRPVRKGGKVRDQRLASKSVSDLAKVYARRLGMDAATIGAHSLRAGFLTSAARRGASIFKMADQSRHKSMDVLKSYVRDSELFQDHAGAGLL
jgi:site-specific recombinase XerD